jgi:hypothetical protein
MKRYAEWCRRQGASAECNPAVMVLGLLVAAGVVIYIYRQMILETILVALLAIAAVSVSVGLAVLTISSVRWYRRKRREAVAAIPAADTWTAPNAAEWAMNRPATDAAAISEEADWLASGVELAFGPDGKLKAK